MKKEFFGFYEPSSEEIEKSWKDGIFIFDANALLNLYRYTDSTRKDFLLALVKLKDKLFMPYQVGYEYHNNRHGVIESLNNSYNVLSQSIKEVFDKTISNLLNQYLRHPSIQIEGIRKLQEDFLKKIEVELDKQKKEHPDFTSQDDVLIRLTELYDNKVGESYSKEALKKIYLEGKDRYEQLIPPGYKDEATKRKKGEQNVYGDLIIWKEIIAFANKEKKPVVLVTDDRKEDWWTIENGKTLRPREELVKEFYDLTGIRILIYNADTFLLFAKERKLVTQIKEASITEVKEIRKADETYNTISDILNSDAYKSAKHLYNPATSSFADLIKTTDVFKSATQFYNPITSSFADVIKTTDAFKSANQFYNPITSSFADLIKTTDAFKSANQFYNPVTSSFADLIKTSDTFKSATEFYNPITSSFADFVKPSEVIKATPPSNIKVDDIVSPVTSIGEKESIKKNSNKGTEVNKVKKSEDNADEKSA